MAEDKKNTRKKPTNSSKLQNKTNLSNEELLEQILNKKKQKKKIKVNNQLKENKNETKKTKTPKISKTSELTSDELLNNIIAKNKAKKERQKNNQPKKDSLNKSETQKNLSKKIDKPLNKSQQNEKDLIITRKITFDDEKINLKNKKTLAELRKAIEEFDRLENLSEIAQSSDIINKPLEDKKNDQFERELEKELEKYVKPNNTDYLKNFGDFSSYDIPQNKLKRKITKEQKITILIAICITLFLILVTILLINISNSKSNNPKELPEVIDVINNKEALKYDYNECLNTPLKIEEYPTNLNNSIAKLNDYLTKNYMSSKKQISVYYEDLTTGFNFQINEKNTYYAASTIKVLDALYIYTKAIEGKLDLETTLTYSKKFSYKYSKGLEKHKFGDKISLKNLVKYSIIYSDNGAHQMLINYIGKKNLQEFAKNLGVNNALNGDNFGNIDIKSAVIYMKALNELMENNNVLGEELKSFFIESDQNYLALEEYNIKSAHKYGSYANYYHDYGIIYDNSPYIVVILTTFGKDDYKSIIQDISKHIYELHKTYEKEHAEICYNKIYKE